MSIPFTRWPEEFARRYREKGYWQDLPLTDILTRHAASDSIAVIDGERQLSYRELNQAADNLACSLRRQGIKPGETALVQLGNVAELYITFFALLKLGVAPVLALFSHQRSELNAYASQIEPALLIADRQHALFSGDDFLNTFVAEHSSIRVVQLLNDSGEHNLQDAINHPAEDFTATPSPADEVAYFQLSGGTTGTPKLIPRTHNDYYYSVRRSVEICQFTQQTRYLCAIPAAHNYAMSSPGSLGVFLAGGTVVLAADPSATLCFPLIEKHQVNVTALDIVPPVVVKVETQRTWDAKENWAKVTAQDDNSGVVAIGWERAEKDMGSRHAPDPITWVDSTAEAAFIFTENGSYNAYARDLAGNVSEPYPFIIDHIDKHSPVIDSVEWDKGWSQEKTVTVKAHDTESGLGQYAVTRTADRPAEWQDSNVFANITENGTYYLWAKDNVQRVSADADDDGGDGDGGEGTPDPGPEEIVIDTIDRSRPVMDDILHSAVDNAPAGMFGYPHFNEVDRPELLAHDLADEGWTDSGIKAIYYQFAADEDSLEADWLTYDELDKPAMREEYFGNIYAKAEDNAGNVSDAIFAGFMFEQTEPVAEKTLTPDHWTNGTVEIDLSTDDNLSGVRDITLPDGSERRLVVCKKISQTPTAYPRNGGKIAKKPL